MDDFTTDRIFDLHLSESLICLAYFLNMLSMSLCTTGTGRRPVDSLVLELNIDTVPISPFTKLLTDPLLF